MKNQYHSEHPEINSLKNRNTNNLVRDNDNTNAIWLKPKKPKSRARRLSVNVMSHIRLSNKFGVLKADQQNRGSLKNKDMKIKSLTRKSNSQKKKKKILLLGSSHGRNIGPLLQNHLGTSRARKGMARTKGVEQRKNCDLNPSSYGGSYTSRRHAQTRQLWAAWIKMRHPHQDSPHRTVLVNHA